MFRLSQFYSAFDPQNTSKSVELAEHKMVFGGPLECRNSTAPPTLSFFSSAVSSLLMLITVPGNLLICLAVAKDPYKTLRSPFNLFLLNISAADLVVGLLVLPLSIAFHFLEGIGIMFAPLIKSLHLSFFISCSASVLGIAALSLDRYLEVHLTPFWLHN